MRLCSDVARWQESYDNDRTSQSEQHQRQQLTTGDTDSTHQAWQTFLNVQTKIIIIREAI